MRSTGRYAPSLRKEAEKASSFNRCVNSEKAPGERVPPAAPSVRCKSLMTTSICPHPSRNSSPQENYFPAYAVIGLGPYRS